MGEELLNLAIGKVSDDKDTHSRRIIVFSSGLSTKGDLDFLAHPDWVLLDPEEIANTLFDRHSLVEQDILGDDLPAIEICWYGLGKVAGKQEAISSFNSYRLQEIWRAVLQKMGCHVEFKGKQLAKPHQDYATDISPVVLPEDIISEPWVFLEEQIGGFVPGTTEFIKKSDVIDAVRKKAELINEDGGKHRILIIGTTANWPSEIAEGERIERCRKIGYDRAKAVIQLLHDEFGIPYEWLVPWGMGYSNPWYVDDQDGKGGLNDRAPENRSFVLLEADSQYANDLQTAWNPKTE